MATTSRARRKANRTTPLIAALSPDSPDPDARQDANNPALMAELGAARQRAERDGWISAEALAAETAATPEEVAAARAALDALEAAAARSGTPGVRRRAAASRPTVPNGRILLRLPLSVHQELLRRAETERTSLNQLLLAYISRGLGHDAAKEEGAV